jgi:hypothetical protein
VGAYLSPGNFIPGGKDLSSHRVRGWAGSTVGLEKMAKRKIPVSGGTGH